MAWIRGSGFLLVLLVLASCSNTDSEKPGSKRGEVWFAEQARQRGMDFTHDSGHRPPVHLMPEAVSGGVGLFDMDNDGDLDAYWVQSGPVLSEDRPGNVLFENDGQGSFRRREQSGAEDRGYGMGVACGDYDADGDVDLYVTNYGGNVLLANDGSGQFTDVTAQAGVGDGSFGASSLFFDYDRDGDLDLFVSNYVNWKPESDTFGCENKLGTKDYCGPMTYDAPARDRLYRNDGDGSFTDVSDESGLMTRFGNGLGVVAGDFDDDGWPDLFVANDMNPDQLWVNAQNGQFTDEALLAGVAVDLEGGRPKAGMGVTAGDIDSDGDLDLMVCNLVESSDSVFRNEGEYFTDVTAAVGLGTVSRSFTRFGMGWVDFNNDGWLDLYQANGRVLRTMPAHDDDDLFAEPNVLFRGDGRGGFVEQRPRGGTEKLLIATSRGTAFGDIDGDGGVDILVANRDAAGYLLVNQIIDRGHWIGLDVREAGGGPAEGAELVIRLGERILRRDVRSGFSYLSCSDARVVFGLGDSTELGEIEVHWTDGEREVFDSEGIDRYQILRRGQGTREAEPI